MNVEIRLVKRCRNRAYGNFSIRGRESALITIALDKNKTMAEYGATVLHELLHLWIAILQRRNFKCGDSREHRFIYAVERVVHVMAARYLKPRRKK